MHDGSIDTTSPAAAPSLVVPVLGQALVAAAYQQSPISLSQHPGVGAWARDLYWRFCLFPKGWLDPASWLGQHVLIPFYYFIRLVYFTLRDWLPVHRQRQISLVAQIAAQWTLLHRYRTDPSVYYSSQLYDLPRGVAEIDDYVGRDEIKNGLLKQLHKQQPRLYGRRVSLGDKLIFTRHCEASGLPVCSVIAVVDHGVWTFGDRPGADADYRQLDRDIFVKPVKARGARGAEWFDWLGEDRYRTKKGQEVSRAEVLQHITKKSAREGILVLPKLTNHAEIADLAQESLMVFRVFTCLGDDQQAKVTHAMLRILAKLEPSWPESVEYAVAVNLASGQLGQLCDDYHFAPDAWWDRHPHTAAPIRWRYIRQWAEIVDLAQRAHHGFMDRAIIGWDIALTPAGPILIEGNAYPDTHFMQRVHRQFIGKSPMAPMLSQRLNRLMINGPIHRKVGRPLPSTTQIS